MNQTTRLKKLTITLQKHRRRQAGILMPKLRIRESKPDFRHLTRSKKRLNKLNTGTQESHIPHIIHSSLLSPLPKPGTLDIHTDIIALRRTPGKPDTILPTATPKFQDNRPRSIKHLLIPMPLHRMILKQEIMPAPSQDLISRRLKQAAKSLIFCKFLKFAVPHRP